MRKLQPRSVEKLITKMQAAKERGKAGYAAADRIEWKLIEAALEHGPLPRLNDRAPARAKDNYAGVDNKTGLPKNVHYKVCGVKRWELVLDGSAG